MRASKAEVREKSQKIEDVLEVLERALKEFRQSPHWPGVSSIRELAMAAVAERRRVKPETIRDACVRRLRPQVEFVADFDRLLEDWLRGRSQRIRQVLLARAIDRGDPVRINEFVSRVRTK